MVHSQPNFTDVQSHYDLSNDFFSLFLDPSMTYSCAYFERDDMSLEEAQMAKIDLSLGKCDLRPGMRLLDVGCGWGATARRAAERFDVDVIGLTLSRNQYQYANSARKAWITTPGRQIDFRLQGWEQFEEPVDRIVSIGAFEHFRRERHAQFFERCREILPDDGRLLLHSIVDMAQHTDYRPTADDVAFARFIRSSIFPGAQLCSPETIIDHARRAGFKVTQVQSLQPHYAKTLDRWTAKLQAARSKAIAVTCEETYETYVRYLSGCGKYFLNGSMDVIQFTCQRA